MTDPKEPSWNLNAKQIILGFLAIISGTVGTWKAISDKADKSDVNVLTAKVSSLADKADVESLRKELNELDAKRREDFVLLTTIRNMVGETKSQISKIEDNQVWQIQQEVKRLQWQSFKTDPPAATPPTNVNR